MTDEKKVARCKLSLLELASDLNNVSKACKVMGYSRQQFYEILERLDARIGQPLLRAASHEFRPVVRTDVGGRTLPEPM